MDRINPVQAAYQVNQVMGPQSVTNPGATEKMNAQARGNAVGHAGHTNGASNVKQPTGEQAQKPSAAPKNLMVPANERLSTLEDIFDEKTLKRMGIIECSTCASRTYQDKSDDAGVSFQSPTHLSPAQAATTVVSHEMEHVSNEQAYAREEGKILTGQSVQIFHDVCPECGVSYVSGGVTKTSTAPAPEKSNPYRDALMNRAAGNLVDMML